MSATNPVPVLSDDALREIETRPLRTVHYDHPFVPLSEVERDALCQTVRALREDLRQGELCEECEQWSNNEDGSPRTFMVCGACWNKLQETNTALRERLAQAERDRDEATAYGQILEQKEQRYLDGTNRLVANINELQSQLAQREQEWEAFENLGKRVEEDLRDQLAQVTQRGTCWHCGVALMNVPKPRCEDCPDECDVVNCDALGCVDKLAQQHLDSWK